MVEEKKKRPKKDIPQKVVLVAPFGYYDDEGSLIYWDIGFTETEPDRIADLIARGAQLEIHHV